MMKEAFATIVAAGITVMSSSAMADASKGAPIYIGARSTAPEQETFGYLVRPGDTRRLAFIGPARHVDRVTGDPEKDTIAYTPVLEVLASFCVERE